MYTTSYRQEVHKEQYERSDIYEDLEEPRVPALEHSGGPCLGMGLAGIPVKGLESLRELNERFARYIGRARLLEQCNGVFRKQLETLQRMGEVPGVEEAFNQQICLHRQRLRELSSERARLGRERNEAERILDNFSNRYRNECEYQQQLRGTLEHLNKEADAALLRNLEYQVQSQYLQDDINSTTDRSGKNLAEIQTYVKILNQIKQMPHQLHSVSPQLSEERPFRQNAVPSLQRQLNEYKTALCQLEAQKQRLQNETSALEQVAKTTQESFDEEIRLNDRRIEALRKEVEEAECSLEKYTDKCRHLATYQTSLEGELERYRMIIENEDTRLNSAIIETPIALLTTDYRYTPVTSVTNRGRDITQAVQDVTGIKPRSLAKKVLKMREISPKNVRNSKEEEKEAVGPENAAEDSEERVTDAEQPLKSLPVSPEDVPDGTQISKAIDTLCNIIRERMHQHSRQEPIADVYAKGRYVLVSGESSYMDPCFCSSSSSGGHVFVTICDGRMSPNYREKTPAPIPDPVSPTHPEDGEKGQDGARWQSDHEDKGEGSNETGELRERHRASQPGAKHPKSHGGGGATLTWNTAPSIQSTSYEKVEVVESVEKISGDNKVRGYEETATIVETTMEKTRRNKPGSWPP